jgi:hypothetical protein
VDKLYRLALRVDQRKGKKADDDKSIRAIHEFLVPMPFRGDVWVVQMLVKEFVNPDDLGYRLYTLHIADVSTPASSEPRRIPVSQDRKQSAHWREQRFAQLMAIVKGELDPDTASAGPGINFSRSSAAVVNPDGPSRFAARAFTQCSHVGDQSH